MAKYIVALVSTDHPDSKQDALATVPDAEFVDLSRVDPYDEDTILAGVKDVDAVVYQWARLPARVINAMEKCKVISMMGIGLDFMDVEAATKKGIVVCNNPAYNKHEVANHAFTMICALNRQLFQFDRLTREGKYGWSYLDVELHRPELQTVGLFSFGKISRKIAHKCKEALGMNVIFYDPYLSEEAGLAAGARKVDFETLLKESDYISVNGPSTAENFHIFNKDAFAKMKPSAYIVNCARGTLVDTDALVEALETKTIAGAGIDVFESEPLLPDHPLTKLDNVILSPHSAWHTRESMYYQGYYATIQAIQALQGQTPPFCVNYKELGMPASTLSLD